jgi:hypothetical protein
LEEIACSGGTEAGQESTRTLLRDHLADAAEEAPVVCDGVELDSCLDAVWKCSLVKMFPYRAKLHLGGQVSVSRMQNASERLTHRRV